ncbi:IS6 family transposase [Streptomyces albus]|uniref:IS6 family transposase n=1 Tax=Streptomyces albus (strain ATCC 21838 / DSM 41398 / FERM P-419 / JCM 4703 / NBRC 107858) TaxID=1081613 RepID=A0A0B5EN38_STRA4|nr:IS6 family transposase [Streptomyces albus]AOU77329.1 IS6 family transposase [Streptomyces albus]AYN33105.1 IS6 family transposase [Streptomyces albus]
MSRATDIDFVFAAALDAKDVFDRLSSGGIQCNIKGKLHFVIDEDELFDWKSTDWELRDAVIDRAASRGPQEIRFGFTGMLDSHHGGDFLLHLGWRRLSFMAEINRKRLHSAPSIGDISWYLEKIAPSLAPLGIQSIEARDA